MEKKTSEKFSEVVDLYKDEIETRGDFHRMAALLYMQAAKQHEAAAKALDNDDQVSCDLHAIRAYKHELHARQYSEIVLMDTNDIDDIETAESIA
jgi:hypothetical protein